MYKLSAHAINQYCIRTGANLMTGWAEAEKHLYEHVHNAVTITQKEAVRRGFTVTAHKKNVLRFWHNDCIDEDMLAITRDGTVITVLLPYDAMHSGRHKHNSKIRYDYGIRNRAEKG